MPVLDANQKSGLVTQTPAPVRSRSKAPVFVLGCPRSGTTYLYHVLLSAGNFAIYRAESEVFHLLEPRFGHLGDTANKQRLLDAWLRCRLFTATGLNAATLREKVMRECNNAGDFLRIVMEETARHQRVERWAECTPDHILYLPHIKRTIPDALVIHIIRDGRDVALSMEKQGWPQQLPWDRMNRRMAGAVYWDWMVSKGRKDGAQLGPDYIEVQYEELINQPREVLERLSSFVGQELNYDEIQRVAIGSVRRPNTSFAGESESETFDPIGRWKKFYSPEQAAMFDELAGETLKEVGYEPSSEGNQHRSGWNAWRAQYRAFFEAKFYLRTRTPLSRLLVTRDLSKV
jgi:hypothetical protein